MSLIHLEKSVLTFHLKEILEDGHGNHPLTWIGLSILIFGPKLLSLTPAPPQQGQKHVGFTPISLSQWVAAARKRELEAQMYAAIKDSSALSSDQIH